jgi:hypothetical protein
VVFHCTDAELAGLIESYRTSEAHIDSNSNQYGVYTFYTLCRKGRKHTVWPFRLLY